MSKKTKNFSPAAAIRNMEKKTVKIVKEKVVPKVLEEKEKNKVPIPAESIVCKNCGTRHQNRYCPECGQRSDIKRLNWKGVFENITKGIFNTDRGFIFTIKSLFVRPGGVIVDYLNGKRVKYFPPFPSMFIIAAFYALVKKIDDLANPSIVPKGEELLSKEDIIENVAAEVAKTDIMPQQEETVDSLVGAIVDKALTAPSVSDKGVAPFGDAFNGNPLLVFVSDTFRNNFGLILLLATPIFVMALRWSYGKVFRKKYNWAESFIMSGFMNTQFFLVLALLTLIAVIFPGFEDRANSLSVMCFVGLLAWDMYPIAEMTKKRYSLVRSLLTYLLFFVLLFFILLIIAAAVIAIYIWITGDEKLTFNL